MGLVSVRCVALIEWPASCELEPSHPEEKKNKCTCAVKVVTVINTHSVCRKVLVLFLHNRPTELDETCCGYSTE